MGIITRVLSVTLLLSLCMRAEAANLGLLCNVGIAGKVRDLTVPVEINIDAKEMKYGLYEFEVFHVGTAWIIFGGYQGEVGRINMESGYIEWHFSLPGDPIKHTTVKGECIDMRD